MLLACSMQAAHAAAGTEPADSEESFETVTVVGTGVSNMEAASPARSWEPRMFITTTGRSITRWLLALDVFNLFDKKRNDIEYYYVSRLKSAAAARPDFVVHPGVPLTVRAHFQYFL